MDVKIDDMKFCTDSNVMLGYIYKIIRKFYLYVSDRVERIRKFSSPEQWHYVPTSENPADVANRSVHEVLLLNTIWLTMPKFLLLPMKEDALVETDIKKKPTVQPAYYPLLWWRRPVPSIKTP